MKKITSHKNFCISSQHCPFFGRRKIYFAHRCQVQTYTRYVLCKYWNIDIQYVLPKYNHTTVRPTQVLKHTRVASGFVSTQTYDSWSKYCALESLIDRTCLLLVDEIKCTCTQHCSNFYFSPRKLDFVKPEKANHCKNMHGSVVGVTSHSLLR